MNKTLKFNKKVIVLPVERYEQMRKETDGSDIGNVQQIQQEHNEKENEVNDTVDMQTGISANNILDRVSRSLPSDWYKRASAIYFTLSSSNALDGMEKNDVFQFLLHSQSDVHKQPGNIYLWYNLILRENVPLHLFSNDTLRRQLGHIKLCDSDESDEEKDNEPSIPEETIVARPIGPTRGQFIGNGLEIHEQVSQFKKSSDILNHQSKANVVRKRNTFAEKSEVTAAKKKHVKNWIKL